SICALVDGSGACPDRKSMRSRITNWSTHSVPYAPTFAAITTAVRARAGQLRSAAHAPARWTVSVERARPANDRAVKGITSQSKEGSRLLPHTQRRFSSNDGTVPAAVATTFAHPAGRPSTPTRSPSKVRLVAVATAETEA